MACALARVGFRVMFGPRDVHGRRPFVARKGREVVEVDLSVGVSTAVITPQQFTISS